MSSSAVADPGTEWPTDEWPRVRVGPSWWFNKNFDLEKPETHPILRPDLPQNNRGVANLGQAKWMVRGALVELRRVWPPLANQVQADLEAVHGEHFLDVPQNEEERQANRAPLLVGQLKSLAEPFFQNIYKEAPEWLLSEMVMWGLIEPADEFLEWTPDMMVWGLKSPGGGHLPWTPNADDDDNRAVATIGQLKSCFTLEFATDVTEYSELGERLPSISSHLLNLDARPNLAQIASPYHDFDRDGMPDRWEKLHRLDWSIFGILVNDFEKGPYGDLDGDGVTNRQEYQYGCDPRLADTDGDGVSDYDEIFVYFTPPSLSDMDMDGLNDALEIFHGTDYHLADTDGDGLNDGDEVLVHLTNPLSQDTDVDGMPDRWEIEHGLNPLDELDRDADADGDTLVNYVEYLFRGLGYDPSVVNDASQFPWEADPDRDGLTNREEIEAGTDPLFFDTDGDLLPDGWEVKYGLDPKSAEGDDGIDGDPDQDGLSTFKEMMHGTNPSIADSDGDGASDFDEVVQGSDPKDGSDGGQAPPPEEMEEIPFRVGDPSGSHSERWKMMVEGKGPEDQRKFEIVSREFGVVDEVTIPLRKGNRYEITLEHVATEEKDKGPDYDWEAQVDGVPTTKVLAEGAKHEGASRFEVIRHGWILDNEDGLLGAVDQNFDSENHAEGKKAALLPVEVRVNDTDKEEDDLVAVSKGTDEDLATDFSVKVSGMGGLTADLKVKGTDGGIKFKDPTLTLIDGAETKTKLWGTSPSSDKDKTIIEITLKKDGNELGKIEEEVTVFKGAKLEFEGNFYINVDTREFARRPWDGRADPKPNSKGDMTGNTAFMTAEIGASPTAAELAAYKKAVDQSFSFGYESAISFKEGDNPSIPNYKPWKDNLEVKVTKVMAKQPSFEITGDQMKDAVISLKNGHLEGPDANEILVDPEVSIADFLTLEKVTSNTNITFKANGGQTVTDAQVAAQITAARGGGYDELLDFFARRTGALAGFSGMRFEWMNDTFEVKKEAKIKDSFAAKAIKGEKENGGKVEVKWFFTKWNEFKFQGDLDDAVIETK